jgi:nitrite reductase (NADH) small subunit
MTDWVDVGSRTEIMRKRKMVVRVDETDVVLFTHEDRIYALADLCVHKQKRLSRGLLFKGKAICPGHQWAFDLESGWTDEWSVCQPTYRVRCEEDRVLLDPEARILAEKPAATG